MKISNEVIRFYFIVGINDAKNGLLRNWMNQIIFEDKEHLQPQDGKSNTGQTNEFSRKYQIFLVSEYEEKNAKIHHFHQ